MDLLVLLETTESNTSRAQIGILITHMLRDFLSLIRAETLEQETSQRTTVDSVSVTLAALEERKRLS